VKVCGTAQCSWMQGEGSDLDTCETTEGGWMKVKVGV